MYIELAFVIYCIALSHMAACSVIHVDLSAASASEKLNLSPSPPLLLCLQW